VTAEGGRRITAGELAALTGGRLIGSADVVVQGVAALDRAGPNDLSFLVSRRYLPYFQRSQAAAVLCSPEFAEEGGGPPCRIIVPDPQVALLAVVPVLYPKPAWTSGIHPSAVIGARSTWEDPVAIGPHAVLGEGVRLGRNVRVGAGCVLGDGVQIGDDVELHPQVVCYGGTVVGNRVTVHAGARLGSDGFGYVPGQAGELPRKIPQVGRCIIGDDVEIGANTTIDRGSVDDTVIGAGTKIDNQVHVAHNVRIGARCLIAAQVGIAGSTHVEDDVLLGGQSGLGDHLHVGRGVRVTGGGGVIGDIEAGATVSGFPARPHREFLRAQAALHRLAQVIDQLEALVRAADATKR
jgi:UDP-3-O-[3-hydroxymyristoyl] glucosamine N-acyltransferase